MQSAGIDIRLFGPGSIRIVAPAAELRLAANAKNVAAYVLLSGDRALEREEIAFALWPDVPEEEAYANLRRALHLLQRALESVSANTVWLNVDRHTIAWNRSAPYACDVEAFERHCKNGHYAQAAELYAGDLLTAHEAEWLQPHRERLREMQFGALAALVEELRAKRDYVAAIAYAKQALRLDPWREDFVRALISLRSESGDRAGALGEYRTFAAALKREMGVEPMPETTALVAQTRVYRGEIPKHARPSTARSNLPTALTAFIGRERELTELSRLCGEQRLVTLVGMGGVGKTRLALEVARRLLPRYSDGLRLIDVTSVRNEASFLEKLSIAFDLHDIGAGDAYARIIAELETRHLLVVLDNCERAIVPCATFAQRVLAECNDIAVLATSREPLGVAIETVVDIAPLPLSDAVELMCRRVAAVFPRFALTDENAPHITQICEKLDGIPLAIELAASHARALSPMQILHRLDDRFTLLRSKTPTLVPHQQTLRGTIDWSYDSLPESLARPLRALAVFRAGFTLDGLRAVAVGENGDALDVLERLIDTSFVTTVARAEENRYALLETIRQYLLGKLFDAGEADDVRMRHLEYMVALAERVEPLLTTHEQRRAIATLADENDNLRAAFDWRTTAPRVPSLHLRLFAAVRWYYWFRGFIAEGRLRGSEVLSQSPDTRDREHARALAVFAFLAAQQGDMHVAAASLHEALHIYDEVGYDAHAALAEIHLGLTALFTGDAHAAERHVGRAAQTATELNDQWLRAYALGAAGLIAGFADERPQAVAAFTEAVQILEELGETFQRTFWLINLAIQEYHIVPERALDRFLQVAELGLQQRNDRIIAGCFEGFAWCLQRRGEFEPAARYLGAAEALRARTAQALLPQWHRGHNTALAAITSALGDERLHAAMHMGAQELRTTSLEALCAAVQAQPALAHEREQ